MSEPTRIIGSETFRSRLLVDRPATWHVKDSVTLLAPDGQANIIFSSEPLDDSITTEHYAGVQGELLRNEFPGYSETFYRPIRILGGNDGYIRQFEWTPPDGVPVTQIQLYYAEGSRGYTATATTPSINFPSLEATLLELLGQLDLI